MKTTLIVILFQIFPLCIFSQGKIAVAGSGNPAINIIDKLSGKVEWTHRLDKGEECNSVAITGEGNILYSYRQGAKLISPDYGVLWDFKGPEHTEVQSASLLANGNYLLGVCGEPARILELDGKGNIICEITLDLDISNPHSQFRQIRKLSSGNYLIPVLAKQQIWEITSEGKIVHTHPVGCGPFSITEVSEDTLLLPCGDKHYFIYIHRETGELIKRVENKDVDGVELLFVAQIIILPNGNLLVCNWDGHTKGDTTNVPQLIELDENFNVVWTFTDKENVGRVSAAFYIE